MEKLLTLRRGFAAGEKNDSRDVETITEALRATGFLKRPASGGKPPAQAEVGRALRDFQDREGLVVDGRAAPLGPTERHLSNAVQRAAVLAARPARTGPLRFRPITGEAAGALRRTANGLMRTGDHRGAVGLFRRAFEDDPEGGVPEAIHFAGLIERMDRKKGARFRGELVKMAEAIDPALARHIAAGRIVADGGTRAGTSLLSQAAFGTKTGAGDGPGAGDPPARTVRSAGDGDGSRDDATELARTLPLARVRDRAREVLERTGDLDEAAEAGRQAAAPGEAEGLLAATILRSTIVGFRTIGYGDAADALSHYLDGEGEDIDLAPVDIRKYKIIQFAEEANRDRITKELFAQPGGPSGSQGAFADITRLKDGEFVDLGPIGKRKNVRQADVDRLSAAGDPEGKYFIGKTRLVSEAKLRAERHGDTIVITGRIEHVWSDPYDFTVKTPEGEKPSGAAGSETAVTAERTGYAERYNRGSGWTQRVRITISIADGRPGTPQATWEDTDEVVDWKTWKPSGPLD